MSDHQHEIRVWLQEQLKQAGHGSKGRLAEVLGVRPDAITRMANTNPQKETRVIKAHEHQIMLEFFNQSRRKEERHPGLREVTVAAHVQAGHWVTSWEWNEADQYPVYVHDDEALRPFKLYGAETRGPSMNRRYPERTVLVFTSIEETMEEPVAGKRYIVERIRPGGEAEHTVKLLHQDEEGKFWLLPESDDPRYQAPISVEEGDEEEVVVKIVGRVRYSVQRE